MDGRAECVGVSRCAGEGSGTRGVANVLVLVRVRTRRKVGARKVYTGAVRCGW